jgi:hypothetical protein
MKSVIKIVVCSHKKDCDYVKNDNVYMPVQGGKAISDIDTGFQGDDTGENISAKNLNYCELTVLYWAWKNLKNVDYIGLNHYRRYFLFSRHIKALKICPLNVFLKMKKTTFNLESHLGKYDIILARPLIRPYSLSIDYSSYLNSEDYRLLKRIINDIFPEYSDSFCYIMEYNNRLSQYNMFITKWEIFDDYCKWLFAVLWEVEKQIYSASQARIYGYMSEYLLGVYVHKNKLKAKYYPVIKITNDEREVSLSEYIIKYIKHNLSFFFNIPWKRNV